MGTLQKIHVLRKLSNPPLRYTYSLVFAADMYATVFKADPFDPTCWRLYREKILVPGASIDEMEILTVRLPVYEPSQSA